MCCSTMMHSEELLQAPRSHGCLYTQDHSCEAAHLGNAGMVHLNLPLCGSPSGPSSMHPRQDIVISELVNELGQYVWGRDPCPLPSVFSSKCFRHMVGSSFEHSSSLVGHHKTRLYINVLKLSSCVQYSEHVNSSCPTLQTGPFRCSPVTPQQCFMWEHRSGS